MSRLSHRDPPSPIHSAYIVTPWRPTYLEITDGEFRSIFEQASRGDLAAQAVLLDVFEELGAIVRRFEGPDDKSAARRELEDPFADHGYKGRVLLFFAGGTIANNGGILYQARRMVRLDGYVDMSLADAHRYKLSLERGNARYFVEWVPTSESRRARWGFVGKQRKETAARRRGARC